MSESFGARLRRRREEQHIALTTIAEQTKIKQSLLEALERDDVSHWPSGIFRRAFIRAYAHAINLDPDVVVHDFFEVFPEPAEVVTPAALAAAADAARGTGAPPNRLRSLIHSAVGSLSRRQRHSDVSIAPRDVGVPNMPEPSMVAFQDQQEESEVAVEHYLPRGLSRMEQALDQISASARTQAPDDANPDFVALAQVCSELARVDNPGDVRPLLRQAATILNAIGVVLWVWDHLNVELRPAVACGYSDPVLAQLPNVSRDADNVTAVALRSGQPCSIEDNHRSALALPLLTPAGCAGVLAFELPGSAPTALVRAAATFVAAQLAQLLGGAEASEVQLPPVSAAVAHSRLAC